jgi:acetate kinase
LEGIEGLEQVLGEVPQVAVFDTAFHASMPTAVKIYPIPYEWFEKGIRRYGFHGTSHRYCAQRTAQLLGKPLASLKLVTCHLGNGCSLVAIRNGIGVDTTMGFTPLEGLMMGSRCGSIDPAILIYLQREHHFTTEQLSEMLNRQSGLKGVSGVSADLRAVLEARAKGNERAALAFDLFIHRLKAGVGSMITSLEGLDAITFTGGIGENSVVVREKVCQGFEFLGLRLDLTKNAGSPVDCDLAMPESTVRILTVHTQEHWAIAQECWHHALRMRGAF